MTKKSISPADIIQNILIGLTVSFVALSLGAAFGILSERGAFAGMFSAGLIAFITSLFGGTRVQCSGPTAPMSAITAVVVAFAYENALGGIHPDHFINMVFLLTGLLLVLAGLLRLGRFITIVPNVVISGFMNGIAVLVWLGQINYLFGFGGKTPLEGPLVYNLLIVLLTLVVIFVAPLLLKKYMPVVARYLTSTLLAIVIVSFVVHFMKWPVEHVNVAVTLNSFSDFTALVSKQWPTDWSSKYLLMALPYAAQLCLLCYLDTLLTSLVVDKLASEKTQQNKELVAQGVANASIVAIGGIPGAQATIRSVLMLKEGATLRLAGVFVGIFVLLEMVLFQKILTYIPQAVFTGILFKVGYDVFDGLPIRLYFHELFKGKIKLSENIFRRHPNERIFVTNMEMLFIVGTTAITVLFDLNSAVIGFTMLFYVINKFVTPSKPIRDLKPGTETELFTDQN